MKKINPFPSILAEWQALINEAQARSSYSLNEELESYLVFLLMRFATNPAVSNKIMALEFLSTLQLQHRPVRHQQLREVGDNCLLFAGLFPERAQKRRVNISYFVNMGQSAYGLLANEGHEHGSLFAKLSLYFEPLMKILDATRPQNNTTIINLSQSASNDIVGFNQIAANEFIELGERKTSHH